MKTTFTLFFLMLALYAGAQVPNPGFENWTSGNPDLWTTNNVIGFATPVTSTTPAYTGSLALRGEVINPGGGNFDPLVSTIDLTGHGFAISQSYNLFSFYCKYAVAGTSAFTVAVYMTDAGGAPVAAGGQLLTGSVSTFTQVSIPVIYTGPNPTECIILITIADTAGGTTNLGDYFIIDELSLGFGSGLPAVKDPSASISGIWPNPASSGARINYYLPLQGDVTFGVYGLDGKKVQEIIQTQRSPGNHVLEMDVATLPAGIYTVRMTMAGTAATHEQKLVINR